MYGNAPKVFKIATQIIYYFFGKLYLTNRALKQFKTWGRMFLLYHCFLHLDILRIPAGSILFTRLGKT